MNISVHFGNFSFELGVSPEIEECRSELLIYNIDNTAFNSASPCELIVHHFKI